MGFRCVPLAFNLRVAWSWLVRRRLGHRDGWTFHRYACGTSKSRRFNGICTFSAHLRLHLAHDTLRIYGRTFLTNRDLRIRLWLLSLRLLLLLLWSVRILRVGGRVIERKGCGSEEYKTGDEDDRWLPLFHGNALPSNFLSNCDPFASII